MTRPPRIAIGRLRASLDTRGVGGTIAVLGGKAAVRVVRRYRDVRELLFDVRHGVRTRGVGEVREGTDANRYEVTPPRELRRALRDLRVAYDDYVFVDVGCGRGAALLVAAELPFRRVVGLEIYEDLAADARATARRAKRPVEVVQTDAGAWELPAEPLLLYLYNPFGEQAMRRLLDNLAASLDASPRPVRVVYRQPDLASMLDDAPFLQRVGGHGRVVLYATRD